MTPDILQDPAVTSGNLDRVEALLFKLDRHLIGKQYIAGNRFTVADVAVGGDLLVISTCMPYVIPRFAQLLGTRALTAPSDRTLCPYTPSWLAEECLLSLLVLPVLISGERCLQPRSSRNER